MTEDRTDRQAPRRSDGAVERTAAPADEDAPQRAGDRAAKEQQLADAPVGEHRRVRVDDQCDADESDSETDRASRREAFVGQQHGGEDGRQNRVEAEEDGTDSAGRVGLAHEQERVRQAEHDDPGREYAGDILTSRTQLCARAGNENVGTQYDGGDVVAQCYEQ